MKFRIHYTLKSGEFEDSFVVSGETIEDCRVKADEELDRRGGEEPWSEEISQ